VSEDPVVMGLLAAAWVTCGVLLLVSGVRARRHPRWRRVGRVVTAVLYLAAGAAVNAAFLIAGVDYAGFADASPLPFVSDTWESLVVPQHHLFISLLVPFETAVGVLVLLGGRATRLAYVAAIGFHVALMVFGFGFWLWCLPLLLALGLLLRAEVRADVNEVEPGRPTASPAPPAPRPGW
jgi:hypothetical protein